MKILNPIPDALALQMLQNGQFSDFTAAQYAYLLQILHFQARIQGAGQGGHGRPGGWEVPLLIEGSETYQPEVKASAPTHT